jgi:hypothetical protein
MSYPGQSTAVKGGRGLRSLKRIPKRIQQLDKLAAGGYITPEEYKAKKQSILSGL